MVAKDNLSKQKRDLLKEMVLSYNQMASDNQQTDYAFIKYHGRYCGYGNLGGKPQDKLDAACKRHDECYAKNGWGTCKCDYPFVVSALSIATNKKYSYGYRLKAQGAAYTFAVKSGGCAAEKNFSKKRR
ncbi:hypothetical protein [Staphylococcus coagulans]|uniref:Phospholipase A2 domain-containing protein n=1 Tax=Staphylococcus coagulans TaxID=74706 RepID=A0A9X0TLL8_9STAP|nr:hypothetical protein [Staphylococcus coagulans]MBA8770864.1 hypothetical protein [Staphylococcus coagulans]MBA8775882.1 hypothetical protein [Staphylococcus coagulans]